MKIMILEKDFKKKLISRLNLINPGWEDGDLNNQRQKKADIVNNQLKIAIEIKDDTKHKINFSEKSGEIVTNSQNLEIMNARLNDAVRSANRKFKFYPNYRTILLFRTEFSIVDVFCYALVGLHSYSLPQDGNEKLKYVGRKTKYSQYNRKETGCFVIWIDNIYYCPNVLANKERIIEKIQIEKIFGLELKNTLNI
jgi:hypothetical protein